MSDTSTRRSRPVGRQLDEQSIGLEELRVRLRETDLIPSQRPLLDDIERRFALLDQAGVSSVAQLQRQLKSPDSLNALAERSHIDAEYLVLLKRAVRGFFPKPRAFKDVHWLDQSVVSSLIDAGIKKTDQFSNAATIDISGLQRQLQLSEAAMSDVLALSDLCRVQWVSPGFAGALIAAGYRTADALAAADPDTVHEAVAAANAQSVYYNGSVGLRDIGRVVQAARYAPWTNRN